MSLVNAGKSRKIQHFHQARVQRAWVDALESRLLLASQIFVVSGTSPVIGVTTGVVGQYGSTGTLVNDSLVSGLNFPLQIISSGSDLFVLNRGTEVSGEFSVGSVGEYTTTGDTINASLVSGLYNPIGIAQIGSNLYVLSGTMAFNSIGEYTTSGATVKSDVALDQVTSSGIAATGSDLFVLDSFTGTVSEFDSSVNLLHQAIITLPDLALQRT